VADGAPGRVQGRGGSGLRHDPARAGGRRVAYVTILHVQEGGGAAYATILHEQEGGGAAYATILHVQGGAPWGSWREGGHGEGTGGPTAGVGERGEATSEAAPPGCTRGVTP
jgi:hypothetical protein